MHDAEHLLRFLFYSGAFTKWTKNHGHILLTASTLLACCGSDPQLDNAIQTTPLKNQELEKENLDIPLCPTFLSMIYYNKMFAFRSRYGFERKVVEDDDDSETDRTLWARPTFC